MGLVFEVLFLFVGINYIAIELIKDKIADSEYKNKRAEEEDDRVRAEKEREYVKNVEGVVCYSIKDGKGSFKRARDEERECVEVFKTLPKWKHIKSWDTWADWKCDYLKGKAKEEEERRKREYMECVADIIYFANRGKIPARMLDIRREFEVWDDPLYNCGFEEKQELMLWWRNKIRSMGVNHELWFCYEKKIELKTEQRTVYRETRRCKCPIEYASPSTHGRYCWDMEYDAIHSRFIELPTDSKLPYEIRECPAHWFTTAAISTDYVMRLPTPNEWTLFCNSYDLLNEPQFDVREPSLLGNGLTEGWLTAKHTIHNCIMPGYLLQKDASFCKKYSQITESSAFHGATTGSFRPAFEMVSDDICEQMSYEIGRAYVIGSLYMEGKPVRITTGDPPVVVSRTKRGEVTYEDPPIEHYEVASILELGEPREDPQYQIMGIYIGDGVFISRDILLDKISYSDIEWAINKAKELRALQDNNK